MADLLQLRMWQAIEQNKALEWTGTVEGSMALAASKRYGLAADRIAQLEAELAALRAQSGVSCLCGRCVPEKVEEGKG